MDPYAKLARDNIVSYVTIGKKIKLPKDLPQEMIEQRAGVFVSLHTNDGDLRGCIGTILPVYKNIADEIIENSISSCSRDPRFVPVQKYELEHLVINVDVLTEPVPVMNIKELNPKKYGVIISTTDGRCGLLLPHLEGVDTIDDQIQICCQKGGIDEYRENLILQKFEVVRHEE